MQYVNMCAEDGRKRTILHAMVDMCSAVHSSMHEYADYTCKVCAQRNRITIEGVLVLDTLHKVCICMVAVNVHAWDDCEQGTG